MNQESNKSAAAGKETSPQQGGSKSYPLDAYSNSSSVQQGDDEKSPYFRSEAPSVSLPKGGGAIRGLGETFSTNGMTGTGSLTGPGKQVRARKASRFTRRFAYLGIRGRPLSAAPA